MKKGIIYLIQPQELLGTRTYKIGCLKTSWYWCIKRI